MFNAIQALVLGAVQGLTEFLPISSSAHLVFVPWLFKWEDPGLAFDVALHLGTLLALLVYYWREWLAMLASIFNDDQPNRRLFGLLIIASIPGAIIGLIFEKQAETVFRSPFRIAITLAVLGVVLWQVDRIAAQRRTINEIGLTDALLLGFSQAFAIFPGVSRSGATITMARALGLNRQDAASFSFLMATPIIAGAGLVETPHLIHIGASGPVIVGFVSAAVIGLAAIAGLLRYVRTRTYEFFAWYRIAAAAVVIAIFMLRG